MKKTILFLTLSLLTSVAFAQQKKSLSKLAGFDQYMEKLLKDWNAPGVGVGIVLNNELVFVKGYGYRDYNMEKPLS